MDIVTTNMAATWRHVKILYSFHGEQQEWSSNETVYFSAQGANAQYVTVVAKHNATNVRFHRIIMGI